MKYEEFCEMKQTSEKLLGELTELKNAVSRLYGPKKLETIVEEYNHTIEQDRRHELHRLFNMGKL